MKYPIYEQCENSIKQACTVLEMLRQRKAVNEAVIRSIRLRRHTADIAMQATFKELRRTFITPIDREDLLRLRQVTEMVACCAEDAVLTLFRHRQPTAHPNDTALLSAVNTECRILQDVAAAFPDYPRSDAVLKRLADFQRQHRQSEEQNSSELMYDTLKKISAACFSAAEVIRYVLLKVT